MWKVKGGGQGFNPALLEMVETQTDLLLLALGGLANHQQIRPILKLQQVSGVVVGNALNYREHAIGYIKNNLTDLPIRPHTRRELA